jgi:hypothetical protein
VPTSLIQVCRHYGNVVPRPQSHTCEDFIKIENEYAHIGINSVRIYIDGDRLIVEAYVLDDTEYPLLNNQLRLIMAGSKEITLHGPDIVTRILNTIQTLVSEIRFDY